MSTIRSLIGKVGSEPDINKKLNFPYLGHRSKRTHDKPFKTRTNYGDQFSVMPRATVLTHKDTKLIDTSSLIKAIHSCQNSYL